VIYYLDCINHPYVLQSQRFKEWFFPRHQVKPTLLGPVDQASLYRWTLSTKHAGHQLCEDLAMSYKVTILTVLFEALIFYPFSTSLYLSKRAVIILILSHHFVTHSWNNDRPQLECMASVLSTQCPPIETSSIDRTQQSRFHLMTRQEPSLETLWLQNIKTMDKVQIIDRSNTAPSSKTFRDELFPLLKSHKSIHSTPRWWRSYNRLVVDVPK
jgi:hypothetical protein